MKVKFKLAAASLVALSLAGCGSSPAAITTELAPANPASVTQSVAATSTTSDVPKYIHAGRTTVRIDMADSFAKLMAVHNLAIIGTVTAEQDVTNVVPQGYKAEDLPPDHPKYFPADQKTEFIPTATDFTVRVEQVVAGNGVRAGDLIKVGQAGGRRNGKEYLSFPEVDGTLLKVGQKYLLFIRTDDQGLNATTGLVRLRMGADSRFYSDNPQWKNLPVVKLLEGLPEVEIQKMVQAELRR